MFGWLALMLNWLARRTRTRRPQPQDERDPSVLFWIEMGMQQRR
jgi:hypothetical protein